MVNIEEYILLQKEERQLHLKLNEPCIERGGDSGHCKSLLADLLDTTISKGNSIHLCHACNNNKCNNKYHLYWGTARENRLDAELCGSNIGNPWQKMVKRYGVEEAKRINRQRLDCQIVERKEAKRIRQLQTGDSRKISEMNSQFGSIWIKKNGKEKKTDNNKLQEFLADGWERGRVQTSKSGFAKRHT